jgi:DNA-binding Lrp family transcriptional regulator
MSGVLGYRFGRVPVSILFASSVGDRACRLFAILSRYGELKDAPEATNEELAGHLGCSVPSVIRAVRELERAGVLERRQQDDPRTGRQRANAFVLIELPPGMSAVTPSEGVTGDRGEGVTGDTPKRRERKVEKTETTPPTPPAGSAGPAHNPSLEETQVFEAWKASTGRNGTTVLDRERLAKIRKALAAYPLAEVLAAVQGWIYDPHNRGDIDCSCRAGKRHKVYNELTLLLRGVGQIERFRDLWLAEHGEPAPEDASGAVWGSPGDFDRFLDDGGAAWVTDARCREVFDVWLVTGQLPDEASLAAWTTEQATAVSDPGHNQPEQPEQPE